MSRVCVPATPGLRISELGRKNFLAGFFRSPDVATFFSGRYALFAGALLEGLKAGDTVLLPAYHCLSLAAPFETLGCRLRFFSVTESLEPNRESVEALLPGAKLLVAVHYFGRIHDFCWLKDVCRTQGTVFMEDCSHVLPDPGWAERLRREKTPAIFSLQKFLPVHDGGVLIHHRAAEVPRGGGFSSAMELRILKRTVELFRQKRSGAGQTRQGGGDNLLPPVRDSEPWVLSHWFDAGLAGRTMSGVSRQVAGRVPLEEIGERRREVCRSLAGKVERVGGYRMAVGFSGKGDTPYMLPLLPPTGVVRPDRYLRSGGIPCNTFGEVLHPGVEGERYPWEHFLSGNLFLLPVHQDLSPNDLDIMIEALEKYQNAMRCRSDDVH